MRLPLRTKLETQPRNGSKYVSLNLETQPRTLTHKAWLEETFDAEVESINNFAGTATMRVYDDEYRITEKEALGHVDLPKQTSL